jgi:hypothetical protein
MTDENTQNLIERNEDNGFEDLTPLKRAFVLELVANGYKHGLAAKAVGADKGHGIRLLRDPLVCAYIKHVQNKQNIQSIISQDFVRGLYLELIPKLMGEESVNTITSTGASVEQKKFHSGEMVSILKDLSKIAGVDGMEDTNNLNLNVTFVDPPHIEVQPNEN